MTTSSFLLSKRTTRTVAPRDVPDGAYRTAPSLRAAIQAARHVAVIAEFKRRSPSGGPFEVKDPEHVAQHYAQAGASAMSILTDAADFGGDIADIATVARACPSLPLLRKDFLTRPEDLFEARNVGASAALLIVGLLTDQELPLLMCVAREIDLEVLVEVHDEGELGYALECGADFIGINNRDLHRLQTDLAVTERLARLVPTGVTLVSESGIRTAADVARMRDAGAQAVLVGEALLRCQGAEREQLLRALASVPR